MRLSILQDFALLVCNRLAIYREGIRSVVSQSVAVSIAFVGALALVKGYRNHGRKCVPLLMAIGLAFISGGAWNGDHLPSHAAEVAITLIGSGFMIGAHRINHTFCQECSCSRSAP
jgi:hypothetical protein